MTHGLRNVYWFLSLVGYTTMLQSVMTLFRSCKIETKEFGKLAMNIKIYIYFSSDQPNGEVILHEIFFFFF